MRFLLFPFSLASRAVCAIKNVLYRRGIFRPREAPLPVISVGNITLGGSEKTPLVMAIIARLLDQGFRPAVVTRGYRGSWEKSGGMLSDGRNLLATWRESGDEPFMIARNFPAAGVFIGRDRLSSCVRALGAGFNTAVLDDGFQHRRLGRGLDIVLHDPRERTALRESVSTLGRAHVILIGREVPESLKERLKKRFPDKDVLEYDRTAAGYIRLVPGAASPGRLPASQDGGTPFFPGPGSPRSAAPACFPPSFFLGKKVVAFCGIARPRRFFSLLASQGADIAGSLSFPDHHVYPAGSMQKIARMIEKTRPEAAVTTEKDAVKIMDRLEIFGRLPVYYLKLNIRIEGKFYETITRYLKSTGLPAISAPAAGGDPGEG